MRIGVGINLARVGVLGGDFGVGLGPGGLGVQAAAYLGGISPYHWFDFVNNRALYAGADVGNVTQATGYTFTRASQGYYTNSDGTLTLFGYNLLLRSQEFDNASWDIKTNILATANQTTAPDGTTTADKITSNNATGGYLIAQGFSATNATIYTASFFLKAAELGFAFVGFTGTAFPATTVAVNLSTGAISAGTGSPLSSSTQTLANGWYRITVSIAATSTATGSPTIYLSNDGLWANRSAAITIGSGIYVWGAQLDLGAQATTYVPTTSAAAGALRRGDRGVLIEGARTNLLLQSQTFDNASWTVNEATTTADAATAPDGTQTADTLIPSTNSVATHRTRQAAQATTAGATVTFSVFLKAAGYSFVVVRSGNAGETAAFQVEANLAAGTIGTASAYGTGGTVVGASITALANGWYRVELTGAVTTVTNYQCSLYAYNATGAPTFAGNGTSGVYLWGAQLEAASFGSSYVPTTSASATRAAEVLTYTAGVSYPLTMWIEMARNGTLAFTNIAMQVDSGSNNERGIIGSTAGDLATAIQITGGSTVAAPTVAGTMALNTAYKVAGRFEANNCNAAQGGTLGTNDTSCAAPATSTALRFGSDVAGGGIFFGFIRRAAVFNSALSDANLQTVTT